MKTYTVVEKHIGDDPHNPYVPGDEKYGTRTMTAADAKPLLDLNLIAEIPDAPEPPAPAAPAKAPAKKVAH